MMKNGTDVKQTEQREFICVATFLPIKSWKHIIPFMMLSSKVLKQIKNSKGIVNHDVKANFAKKFFWTLSIWNDKESVRLFVPAEPHATAIKKFTQWAGDGSAFVEWTSNSKEINWPEAFARLQNPTFYYKKQ